MDSQLSSVENKNGVEISDEAVVAEECCAVDNKTACECKKTFDTKSKLFIPFAVTFGAVCLMALGYLLMWVSNLFLGGSGVANAAFITSVVRRIIVCLIYSAILAPAVVAILYAVKMFLDTKTDLKLRINRVGILPQALHAFAFFSVIDSGVIFFFSMLGGAIVGLGNNVIANSYDVIVQILKYWGYNFPALEEKVLSMQDGVGGTILSVLMGAIVLVSSVAHVLLYGKLKNYYNTLANTAAGAQYDKDTKPPYIFALILAGANLVYAILSFVAGGWIEGIIKLGVAAYLAGSAVAFKTLHNDLHKTSVD